MQIAVCLKHVPDPATVEVDPLTGAIDRGRMLFFTDPASEVALELALRLCAEHPDGIVYACTVGPAAAEGVLRRALAVGANRVLRIGGARIDADSPLQVAALLAGALRTEGLPDLVLCGTQSADQGSGQVPALLAENLGWPVATDVTRLAIDRPGTASIQRRLARGAREEGSVRLPAVIGLEPGLVRLRHANFAAMLQAKRATIPMRSPADLGVAPAALQQTGPRLQAVGPPRPRSRTTFVPDTALPAHTRIEQILSAGVTRKAGSMIEGPPEEMAEAIVAFLEEQGFLAERT